MLTQHENTSVNGRSRAHSFDSLELASRPSKVIGSPMKQFEMAGDDPDIIVAMQQQGWSDEGAVLCAPTN